MTPLTVLCVLVKGPYGYTSEYVYCLQRMVARHLKRTYRFVCLTDGAFDLAGIENIRIPSMAADVPANGVGYWNKLQVFNKAHGFSGRMLYIDLDSLIVDDLEPIVDFPARIALTTDALVEERKHLNTDRYGRTLVRRFNGSVMVWDAGVADYLWDDFTHAVAQRLSTDQDWIGEQALEAHGMPIEWFPRVSKIQDGPIPAGARVILCKKPKNAIAAAQWAWVNDVWRAA